MTRTVFDNDQVAHVWAQRTQSEGRSHNGNMSFRGNVLYSYSTPIAAFTSGAEANSHRTYALVTSERFSITTSAKHMPALRRALGYGVNLPPGVAGVFTVPFIAPGGRGAGKFMTSSTTGQHEGNAEYLENALKSEAKSACNWRKSWPDLEGRIDGLEADYRQYLAYCEAFGVAHKITGSELAELIETVQTSHAAYNTPERQAKREADAAKREADRLAKEAKERDEWLTGWRLSWRGLGPNNSALLRVAPHKSGLLETSQGAQVPLDHAVKAFKQIKACKDAGQSWARNGHSIHVGHFQIDKIEANGDIRAGCHFIQWSEIERIAKQLDLF